MYIYIPEKFQSSNSVDLSSHSAALSNSCAVVGVAADAGKLSARKLCTTEE
jgi:hypothetical protein